MRTLFSQGQIRLLTSLTPDGRRVTVSPSLTMDAEDGIVSVALVDVHEFVFLYESLRQAANDGAPVDVLDAPTSATHSGGNDVGGSPTLRAWLGLPGQSGINASDPSPDVFALIGPVGGRDRLFEHAEGCMPEITFTPDQRRVIQLLCKSVCFVSCVAGKGKTHRLAE